MNLDHYSYLNSYLIDRQHRLLLLGIGLLVLAAVFALCGETLERNGLVYRSEEPKRFWRDVAMCFIAGLFIVGHWLYQNSK
jgi:hypothetical protein